MFEETSDVWSAEKCYEIACKYPIDSSIKNPSKQKEVMEQFLDFYCTGRVREGCTLKNVILHAAFLLSDATDPEHLYWHQEFYDKKHVSSETYTKHEMPEWMKMEPSQPPPGKCTYTELLLLDCFLETECPYERFSSRCKYLIAFGNGSYFFYAARRLICFLAQTILGCSFVSNYIDFFREKQFRDDLQERVLQFLTTRVYVCTPCPLAYQQFEKLEKDDEIRSAIAKMVVESERAFKNHLETGIFVLTSLSYIYLHDFLALNVLKQLATRHKTHVASILVLSIDIAVGKYGHVYYSTNINVHEQTQSIITSCEKIMFHIFPHGKVFPDSTFPYASAVGRCFPHLTRENNKEYCEVLTQCNILSQNDGTVPETIPSSEFCRRTDFGRVLYRCLMSRAQDRYLDDDVLDQCGIP